MAKQTKGAFDVTIGPLYDSWLNDDRTPRKPSKKELETARKRTGSSMIELNKSEHTIG